MNQSTFLRIEKKYLITPDQQNRLMSLAGERLVPAEYPDSLVVSLYLDSPDFSMIRRSIEAGNEGLAYKEKLRIRCYGTPDEDSPVFFEVKKKFLGTVSKRRIVTDLAAMDAYLQKGLLPQRSQIMSELDYTMRRNGQPRPVMPIAYNRQAYKDTGSAALRVTFDRSIRFRTDDLDPRLGTAGKRILPPGTVLMEVKAPGFMPLWLAKAIDSCGIRPASFSKAGEALRIMNEEKRTEETRCKHYSLQSYREVSLSPDTLSACSAPLPAALS